MDGTKSFSVRVLPNMPLFMVCIPGIYLLRAEFFASACQAFLFQGLNILFPSIEDECRRSDIRRINAILDGYSLCVNHPYRILPSNARFNISGVLLRVPFRSYKSGLPKTMYLSRSGFETLLRLVESSLAFWKFTSAQTPGHG
jgi:hypothetical protein